MTDRWGEAPGSTGRRVPLQPELTLVLGLPGTCPR